MDSAGLGLAAQGHGLAEMSFSELGTSPPSSPGLGWAQLGLAGLS